MASKRYENQFSFWNIILTFQFVVFVAIVGYCGLPAIVSWFDWFRVFLRNVFFVFLFVIVLIAVIYVVSLFMTPEKKELDLYDQYIAAAPTVVRSLPAVRGFDNGYYNNSGYNDQIVPEFQAVNTVETVMESHIYDRVAAMEVTSSKSYRKTRSEKKKSKMVEYLSTESERVTKKTASWKSQRIEGMSSEEFRMTVETFIMEKKGKRLQQYGVADQRQNGPPHWQNGVSDQRLNGPPHWYDGVADQWLPEQEYGALPWQNGVPNWQNGVPQLQNGVPNWQNGVVQWQGLPLDDVTGHHRHRGRRLVGGSGSTGPGSYLAISN